MESISTSTMGIGLSCGALDASKNAQGFIILLWMHEIDVALSDVLLGLLAVWLGRWAAMPAEAAVRLSLRLVLSAVAAGSFLGGIWHGFFSTDSGMVSIVLWRSTMVMIGLTAYGFAMLGLTLLGIAACSWAKLFRSVLIVYLMLLLVSDDFRLAIAVYFPALLLALAGFIRCGNRPGVTGMLLAVFASAYQMLGPDLEVWLTHNTVYHLLLMPSLWLLWRGCMAAEAAGYDA